MVLAISFSIYTHISIEEMDIFEIIRNQKVHVISVISTSLNSKSTILVSCCNSISIKPNETLSVYTQTKHNNYKYKYLYPFARWLLRLGTVGPPHKMQYCNCSHKTYHYFIPELQSQLHEVYP